VYVATTEDYNPEKETPCLLDIYMSDCEHNAGKICITLSKTKPAKEKKAPVKRAPRAKKVKTQELPPEKDQ
jgi:hypothetical protein